MRWQINNPAEGYSDEDRWRAGEHVGSLHLFVGNTPRRKDEYQGLMGNPSDQVVSVDTVMVWEDGETLRYDSGLVLQQVVAKQICPGFQPTLIMPGVLTRPGQSYVLQPLSAEQLEWLNGWCDQWITEASDGRPSVVWYPETVQPVPQPAQVRPAPGPGYAAQAQQYAQQTQQQINATRQGPAPVVVPPEVIQEKQAQAQAQPQPQARQWVRPEHPPGV